MAIELKDASFAYPDGFLANENLDLVIESGERVAIIGQNGAGKTTCVKMMNGLNRPTGGDVIVDGENTKDFTAAHIAKTVGYVFQNPDDQIFNQTVAAEIGYMPKYFKMSEAETKERIGRAVELTHLEDYLKKNPYDIPYPIRKFVTIAAILVTRPKYVILDEPTAGQDKRGTMILEELMDALGKEGTGVITITHDMEFVARNFDRVIVMSHKNIIADGSASDIFSNTAILEEAKIKMPQLTELAMRFGYKGDYFQPEQLVRIFD